MVGAVPTAAVKKTVTPSDRAPRRVGRGMRPVQGSMAGTAKLSADFDPSAPVFPSEHGKQSKRVA
jgi:hypothetical protein